MDRTGTHRLLNIAATLLLAQTVAISIQNFMVVHRMPLGFDDAYMFLRYAHNIRHGLGFSWNLDGAHTYGPTSLLWSFFTLLFSYLPTDPWTQLVLGSWLFSFAAVIAMAWAIAANAQSDWLHSPLRVLALLAVPLFASTLFQGNQFNGMETMLATTLCALFLGLCFLWRAGRVHTAVVCGVAFLFFLARPESAIVTLLLPFLVRLIPGGPRPPLRSLLLLDAGFFTGVIIELILCRFYFGPPFLSASI